MSRKESRGQGVRVPYRADKIPDQGIIFLEGEVILHFLGSQALCFFGTGNLNQALYYTSGQRWPMQERGSDSMSTAY